MQSEYLTSLSNPAVTHKIHMAAASPAEPPVATGAFDDDPEAASISEARQGAELLASAKSGDVEQTKTLLAGGAPVGFKDFGGWTALTWAHSSLSPSFSSGPVLGYGMHVRSALLNSDASSTRVSVPRSQ